MKEKQIILLGIAVAVILVFLLWNLYTRRNEAKARLRKSGVAPSHQRASDQRPLTGQEIRIKRQAEKLVAKGRLLPAAQMLEQAGFYRDSIDVLENGRLFDEAARVLIRLQRPGRAGVLYSRNGLFGPAAQCFLQAGDALNAAKCFREIGKPLEAAELFAKAAQFADAAECLEKAGLLSEAAKNWMRVNKSARAIVCWNALGQDPSLLSAFKPHQEELDVMLHAIKADPELTGVLKILARSNHVATYILDLLSDQGFETAKKMFTQAPQFVSANLLSSVNIQSPAANYLVNLYRENGQHRNAGILLEQLERFIEASDAFSAAGETERARYCANRAKKGKSPQLPTTNESKPIPEKSTSTPIPKASFFIDSGTQSNMKTAITATIVSEISPPQKLVKMHPEPATRPLENLPLSNDEIILLSRTWLFQGVNEEDVELLISRFQARQYHAGHRIQSGASATFLVMLVTGEVFSQQSSSSMDGWLSPEVGLGDRPACDWVITSAEGRVVCISSADFSSILSRNADLTRQVYINLTQRLASESNKPLISKAI